MDDYALACLPEPVRILGLELKPYSIGHQILLKRFEIAFVTLGKPFALSDFLFSVALCSLDWRGACEFVNSDTSQKEFRKWLSKAARTTGDIQERVGMFLKYIDAGRRYPENVEATKDGVSSSSAIEARMKLVLMREYGYTSEEVLNMPYSQALYEFALWQESVEMVEFVDPETESEDQERADEFDAWYRAKHPEQFKEGKDESGS